MAAKQHKNKKTKKEKAEHLKPHRWAKGQSGNAKGRPPSVLSVTSTLKRMLEWEAPPQIVTNFRTFFPQLPAKPTCLEIMVARSMIKSFDIKSGDIMAKEIWERLDGKVPFPIVPGNGSDTFKLDLDFNGATRGELEKMEQDLLKWKKKP